MPRQASALLPADVVEPAGSSVEARSPHEVRPTVAGKFLFRGDTKLFIRGVTYGPFGPGPGGAEYGSPGAVEADLDRIAGHGFNAIRTYTVPPSWVLELAEERGLAIMIGLPWEQHVAFLHQPRLAETIERRVRRWVRTCAGHPAILAYAVGNEIPASIVRWHGARAVERFLERLTVAARDEDPTGLFAYVNYPSTEYLQPKFGDLVAFNVYLEDPRALGAYLARVHNLAGDRPVLAAEIGADSLRLGAPAQADLVERSIEQVFSEGCAGAFVFAWSDRWHRGGEEIRDWRFGLTDRNGGGKPALAAAARAMAEGPFPLSTVWPRVTVVVCSHNGARTIRQCLDGLMRLDYPDLEVIVVNDGSTDTTESIALEYPVRVVSTENEGLSSARNVGLAEATGDVVAYIDDDAFPDQHWLRYLATSLASSAHVGVGGPNLAPEGDGPTARCVAMAPGGPIHVLLSDREAEHIPGCNMAFRREALVAVGGFDPRFRVAGDDVDVCWRLQERGWTLGFSPSAVVWHHRRTSVREYWRQQVGYGRAEALLEGKWPEKYNGPGHLTWGGRVYGGAPRPGPGPRRGRIYQGVWGTAPFQCVRDGRPNPRWGWPRIPEWYLALAALAILGVGGIVWRPLLAAWALGAIGLAASVGWAAGAAARAVSASPVRSRWEWVRLWSVTAGLHLLQPLSRLRGRLSLGLSPWRRAAAVRVGLPRPGRGSWWREAWASGPRTVESIEGAIRSHAVPVLRGGPFDGWDLEARGGALGGARVLVAVEEHGAGRQLVRCRWWPVPARAWLVGSATLLAAAAGAAVDGAWEVTPLLGVLGLTSAGAVAGQCAGAVRAVRSGLVVVEGAET